MRTGIPSGGTSCSAPSRGSSARPTFVGRSHSRSAIIALFRLGSFIPAPFVDFRNVQALPARQQPAPSGLLSTSSTCSAAARCCSCRSSRSASCRTSPRRSSCSCCAWSSRTSRRSTRRASPARRKLTQYTRYLTIALGVLQSTTLVTVARSGQLFGIDRRPRVPAAAHQRRRGTRILLMIITHDRRHRPHHVDRRARHRARHRQRHVAADLHLDRRGASRARCGRSAQTKGFEVFLLVASPSASSSWRSSSSSSSRSAASRCSTPSAWSAAAPTAATTPTSRSRSTWPASCPSSSPRRCCTCPR